MPSITIVSGSPGTGKTTIARELAKQTPRGVHIVSDEFYYFIADLIAPSSPESRAQNAVVITATARAAVAFASGGYDVLLDGVLGPWFMPLLSAELRKADLPIDLIFLRTTLEDSLARVADREAPGIENVVRKMHGEFVDLGSFESHVVNSHGRTPEETMAEIMKRRASGEFRFVAGG